MNLVKSFVAGIAGLALIGSLAACGADNKDNGASTNNGGNVATSVEEDYELEPAFHKGQYYCTYPDDADEDLFCSEMIDPSTGDYIPRANWVEIDDVPAGFNANREYGDNDALELFLFLYLLGHMDYYDSPRFDSYYHNDSSRSSHKAKLAKYKTKYATTITKVKSNPKYSNYKSTNGKVYTGTQLPDKKKFNHLPNDRVNNPSSGTTKAPNSSTQTTAPNSNGTSRTTQPQASTSTKSTQPQTSTSTQNCTWKKGKKVCR